MTVAATVHEIVFHSPPVIVFKGRMLFFPRTTVIILHVHNSTVLATTNKQQQTMQDLKPNNLLYASDGKMKLADFGLARSYGSPGRCMTPTVVTRWYRPPELCFGCQEYGAAVDMWGVR